MAKFVLTTDVHLLSMLRRYAHTHWRGQQPLAWSFWVNLVALRVVLFSIQSLVGFDSLMTSIYSQALFFVALVMVHGLLLIWQIVGVVRSAEHDFATRGNMALVWGSQLGAVLIFILSIIYTLGAIQLTMVVPPEQNPFARIERERAAQYLLSVDTAKQQLNIDGSIELGITKAVTQLIHDYPLISRINLNSEGGNIYEARGLAKLFRTKKLNTHTSHICASACTTAFVGGLTRTSASGAKIGFHQYRFDAHYSIIVTDVLKEQARDSILFLEAGVSKEFVQLMYDRVPEEMWWPSSEELLHAGFVHEQR